MKMGNLEEIMAIELTIEINHLFPAQNLVRYPNQSQHRPPKKISKFQKIFKKTP